MGVVVSMQGLLTYNHLVPALEVRDLGPQLMDHASKLMAGDEARRDVLVSAIPVKVASAEGRDGHLDNGVAGVPDGRDWAVFDLDLFNAFEDHSPH